MYAPEKRAVILFLQLIAAYKVDYSGTISSEFEDLVEDRSIPKEVLKEFFASGAVRTGLSWTFLRLMLTRCSTSTATAGLCFCKIC